jgi:ferritin
MIETLGRQYQHETKNALRYYQRAIFAEQIGLTHIAAFFRKQADGERGHADAVMQFAVDRSAIIPLSGLTFTDPDIMSGTDPVALFVSAREIENETTAMIEGILQQARDEKDFMTEQWILDPDGLLKEQCEEQNLYQTIIDHIAQMGGPSMIHDLDAWIGESYGA